MEPATLGTLFHEPLWFFYRDRKGRPLERTLGRFKGKPLSIGPEGSAGRAVALKILALNGIDAKAVELLDLAPKDVEEHLIQGKVSRPRRRLGSWESPVVRRLLFSKGIRLLNFPRLILETVNERVPELHLAGRNGAGFPRYPNLSLPLPPVTYSWFF